MRRIKRLFNINHIKILTLLIIIDLIATIIWFVYFGIEEANPILASSIKDSPLKFAAVKLGLSIPGLAILTRYIKYNIAQGGIFLLLFSYSAVTIIHLFILTVALPLSCG